MGSMTIWHWILLVGVGLLLFCGRGLIADLMGDFAKAIQSFKNPTSRGGRLRADGSRRGSMANWYWHWILLLALALLLFVQREAIADLVNSFFR